MFGFIWAFILLSLSQIVLKLSSISRLHVLFDLRRQEVLHLSKVLYLVLNDQRLLLSHLQLRILRQSRHLGELRQICKGILALGRFLKLNAVITILKGAIWIGNLYLTLSYFVALDLKVGLVGLRHNRNLFSDRLKIAANPRKLFRINYYEGLHRDLRNIKFRLG